MSKLPLVVKKDKRQAVAVWRSCLPFVQNTRGVLIHRPREVTGYRLRGFGPHIAVHYWCGNGSAGMENFIFTAQPPEGFILCEKCEVAAVEAGYPPADALAGRHVHKGGIVARQTCCEARK